MAKKVKRVRLEPKRKKQRVTKKQRTKPWGEHAHNAKICDELIDKVGKLVRSGVFTKSVIGGLIGVSGQCVEDWLSKGRKFEADKGKPPGYAIYFKLLSTWREAETRKVAELERVAIGSPLNGEEMTIGQYRRWKAALGTLERIRRETWARVHPIEITSDLSSGDPQLEWE